MLLGSYIVSSLVAIATLYIDLLSKHWISHRKKLAGIHRKGHLIHLYNESLLYSGTLIFLRSLLIQEVHSHTSSPDMFVIIFPFSFSMYDHLVNSFVTSHKSILDPYLCPFFLLHGVDKCTILNRVIVLGSSIFWLITASDANPFLN